MSDLLNLVSPVGRGMRNDEDDVEAIDISMRRIGAYDPPPEYRDAPQRYTTEPLVDALEAFQERNGLKIDGYANPGGPTERAINNRLLNKPRGVGILYEPLAPIRDEVGNGFRNERPDVQGVQRMLGGLGYLPEDPFDRPHGFIDEGTSNAIRRFQDDRGLTADGWLGPRGETETALHDAVSDLARVKGRDWFAFAQRAGRAQAAFKEKHARNGELEAERLSAKPIRPDEESSDGATTSYTWTPAANLQRENADRASSTETPPEENDDAQVVPAQTAPGDAIVPFLFLTLPALLGLGEAARRQGEAQRQGIDDDEKGGGKHENIPPQKSNEPYRGRDLAKPPLDPRPTGPSPSPSEPPKLPDREEIRPETLTPEDWILINPKKLQLAAEDLILRMRGGPRTQGRLTGMREVGEKVADERSDVKLVHIGGARDYEETKRKEFYAPSPMGKELGIKTTKGAAFADLTFEDVTTGDLYHISLYRVSSATKPLKEEIAQAVKLAINTEGKTRVIVMVPNVRGDGVVDEKAFRQFLHETLDAVRGSPRTADMSNPATRDQIIRYFTQLKAN